MRLAASSPKIDRFLDGCVARDDFPGASYIVAHAGRVLAQGAVGRAVVTPEAIAARPDTIYDLASLTKPLATALLAVRLQGEGRLRLADPLSRHIPEWLPKDERASVTLMDLLTHRSGLPGWVPLYLYASDAEGRIDWLRSAPLAHAPGCDVVYSCTGYTLLGFVLERVGGAPLGRLFEQRVAKPLGLSDVLFTPGAASRRRIAATEVGNVRERCLAGARGEGYNAWRTGLIWGEVHDHNSHTLGGAGGNAGLFGTAAAVFALAREFLGDGSGFIEAAARELFGANVTAGLSEDRAVGFQLASTRGCSAGPALSRSSYGHTGFTGTSLWIDPDSRRIYVLLTNRVHPRFRDVDMHAVRRTFHEIAASL
jgi:CubicO group peptidase (beta-lactamase class C family)